MRPTLYLLHHSRLYYSLYTKFYNNNVLIIVLYVDDLLIAGKNEAAINDLKRNLENEFEMVDCGKLKHFLGINIETQNVELSLTQESNIEKVLVKFRMEDCNTVRTPMEKGLQLQRNTENSQTNNPYRELLGSLMYIMLCFVLICATQLDFWADTSKILLTNIGKP